MKNNLNKNDENLILKKKIDADPVSLKDSRKKHFRLLPLKGGLL